MMTKQGLSENDIWKREVISVAQAEDKVARKFKEDGDAKTIKEGKSMAKSLFSENVHQESMSVKLTPVAGEGPVAPTQTTNLFD